MSKLTSLTSLKSTCGTWPIYVYMYVSCLVSIVSLSFDRPIIYIFICTDQELQYSRKRILKDSSFSARWRLVEPSSSIFLSHVWSPFLMTPHELNMSPSRSTQTFCSVSSSSSKAQNEHEPIFHNFSPFGVDVDIVRTMGWLHLATKMFSTPFDLPEFLLLT